MQQEPQEKIVKPSYPTFPAGNWWTLRRKAQQSPPKQIDVTYLVTVLGLGDKAAGNLLSPLRKLGLIDEKGQTTPLLHDWRDDGSYTGACKKMFESIYPEELRAAVPGPNPDSAAVERWFTRTAKIGESASRQMAALYLLLCEADLSKATAANTNAEKTPRRRAASDPVAATKRVASTVAPKVARAPEAPPQQPQPQSHEGPTLHVDVNVHIASDASAEQIDQVFASMAKHFYQR